MGQIFFYEGDIPSDISFKNSVAVDTETMGLNIHRDRLCLVQLADEKGNAYLVKIKKGKTPTNLKKILADKKILKIFHYARFDVAVLKEYLNVDTFPIYCTKIAHKLVRPTFPSHSLKTLCQELLGVELSKEQQVSDWGADTLTDEQKQYATGDVIYLHAIRKKLNTLLRREGREKLAQKCFDFIPVRAELDLLDFSNPDIFEH